MTIKQAHALNQAYQLLTECCEEKGRAASVGELARKMGVHYMTAHSRIVAMLSEGVIQAYSGTWHRQHITRYGVYGYNFKGKV